MSPRRKANLCLGCVIIPYPPDYTNNSRSINFLEAYYRPLHPILLHFLFHFAVRHHRGYGKVISRLLSNGLRQPLPGFAQHGEPALARKNGHDDE